MDDFKGKSVLVVGLARSGLAAVEALLPLGAKITVQDAKTAGGFDPGLIGFLNNNGVKCYFGVDPTPEDRFDTLILSPGVPPELSFIQRAAMAGGEIAGELEIAYRLCKGNFIAITGTNGKTTVTALVGEIFKSAGKDVRVVGNIGTAAISAVEGAGDDTWLITETSSFQLETIRDFKPRVSAILNIAPDHLDRHKNMRNYVEAKARIFENQGANDYFVVNFDDAAAYGLSGRCAAKAVPFSRVSSLKFGAFVDDGSVVIAEGGGKPAAICLAREIGMPGAHNLENALAAAAIAYFAGIPVRAISETLRSFHGVAHRLEPCGEINGVRFVNDSKATNPAAAIKALEAMESPVILIAGGYDKNVDFESFTGAFSGKVKAAMLLGATAGAIKETAESKGFQGCRILSDMEECVSEAYRAACPGDTVLLSPACASWDMYPDFEKRGEDFKDCVKRLEK